MALHFIKFHKELDNDTEQNDTVVPARSHYIINRDQCKLFANNLAKAWNTKGFKHIANISLIPWGKQKYSYNATTKTYTYACQHGINECIGQQLEACIIKLYPDQNDFVPFLIDLESKMLDMKCQNLSHCCRIDTLSKELMSKYVNMQWDNVRQCTQNITEVDLIEMKQQRLTMSLDPLLDWVPWITINEMHNADIQQRCSDSLLDCVCTEYQRSYGTHKYHEEACVTV
eukprot:799218_1